MELKDWAQLFQSGAGIAGGIIGGISQGNLNDWLKGAAVMTFNAAQAGNAAALDAFYKIQSLIQNPNSDMAQGMLRQVLDQAPFLQQSFEQNVGRVNEIFGNAGDRFATQDQSDTLQAMRILAGQAGGTGDIAAQLFAGGGWTPQYQQFFDAITPFTQGRASNAQLALGDVGPNLIGQRGQTAFTQSASDAAMRSLDSGGMSPELQFALNAALKTIAAQGKTPTLENITSQALRLLSSGGATPFTDAGSQASLEDLLAGGENAYTQFAQGRGAELAGREALLPLDEAVRLSTEDAQSRLTRQAERQREQARLRGGTFTRSGAANEALWNSSSDIAEKIAEIRRDAILRQQALRQQENQIGAGLLSSGGGIAAGRYGTSGSTLAALQDAASRRMGIGASLAPAGEQIAAQREATALGAVPGTQSAATGQLEAFLRGGLGAGSLEGDRMRIGTDMSNALTQQQLAALQALLGGVGQQGQYALGAGGLANASVGTQGSMLSNTFQNRLAQQGLGVTAAGAQAGAGNQALGLQNDLYRSFGSNYGTAGGMLNDAASRMLNYAGNFIPNMNMTGALGGINNPWASLAANRGR